MLLEAQVEEQVDIYLDDSFFRIRIKININFYFKNYNIIYLLYPLGRLKSFSLILLL
jgi:hypothetical protein